MRFFTPFAAALLLLPIGGTAVAQDTAAPAAAEPTDADLRRGAIILRSFETVIAAEEADNALKSTLFACLYNNSLGEISNAARKIIAANESLSEDNAQQVYAAAAVACGVKPGGPEQPGAPVGR
ncbi:hypothetical protein [Altericroceibacterium xinjiangense]|uniref:hypothetical protein n=1 Tax=Altericroceibacterium xinjiangense TaxID=762261 RepID=UPI000F7F237C|nr:hypothetical protein [Altericroceibacterium xinjiangense]